mgnify:CR=1 FL=1
MPAITITLPNTDPSALQAVEGKLRGLLNDLALPYTLSTSPDADTAPVEPINVSLLPEHLRQKIMEIQTPASEKQGWKIILVKGDYTEQELSTPSKQVAVETGKAYLDSDWSLRKFIITYNGQKQAEQSATYSGWVCRYTDSSGLQKTLSEPSWPALQRSIRTMTIEPGTKLRVTSIDPTSRKLQTFTTTHE